MFLLVPISIFALDRWSRSLTATSDPSYQAGRQTAPNLEVEWNAAMSLLKQGDRNAIPALERLFVRVEDDSQKQRIASLLVSIGDTNDIYFDYLADAARQAVESDIVYPLKFDGAGHAIRGEYGEEFLAWCDENSIEPDIASALAMRTYPAAVSMLGRTGDARAFDLLVRGLDSPNFIVVAQAAVALGRLGNVDAISLSACAPSPKGDGFTSPTKVGLSLPRFTTH